MLRFDDAADRAGAHHFTDPDRRDIGAAFVEPGTHRGIERDVQALDEEFTLTRTLHRFFGEIPVGACRQSGGTRSEAELMIGGRAHLWLLQMSSAASAISA